MNDLDSRPASSIESEADISKRYFQSFAADYHEAFAGKGRQPLHALINRLFRRKTFERRTEVVRRFLEEIGVTGKHVLDVGCGSGEVSLVAARLGARVTGLDIVPAMVEIAKREARSQGLDGSTTFKVQNLVTEPLGSADVVLLVGVVEYYRDTNQVMKLACAAAKDALIIVDTRGPWWRRQLRFFLARFKHFHLYYHPADELSRYAASNGLAEQRRVAGHSFTALLFVRR